jgi:hypothetical protein
MSRENARRDAARVALSADVDDKTLATGSDEWASGWEGDDEVARRRELGDRHPAWRYRV